LKLAGGSANFRPSGQAVDFGHLQQPSDGQERGPAISATRRLVGAQNARLWAASFLIGIEPTTAQNERLFVSRASAARFRGGGLRGAGRGPGS
jgi:hypothetical protein